MDRASLIASQAGLLKSEGTDPGGGIYSLLSLLRAVGAKPSRGARVLDLGCGIGQGVHALRREGFDAYGVDVYEFWGRDRELYWEPSPHWPDRATADRLAVATLEPYRLPYGDAIFDRIVSSQVLEHVADHGALFAELHRVLRPGGVSVHIFPGRWVPLIEGHIRVPFPALCLWPPYLKAAAWLGFRNARQKGVSWRGVYEANLAQMRICSYPTQRQLKRWAREAGLEARFAHGDYVRNADTGWARLHRHIGPIAEWAAALVLEHMLVLRRPRHSSLRVW